MYIQYSSVQILRFRFGCITIYLQSHTTLVLCEGRCHGIEYSVMLLMLLLFLGEGVDSWDLTIYSGPFRIIGPDISFMVLVGSKIRIQ